MQTVKRYLATLKSSHARRILDKGRKLTDGPFHGQFLRMGKSQGNNTLIFSCSLFTGRYVLDIWQNHGGAITA